MVSHRAFAKFWLDKLRAQLWARASEPKLGLILAPVGSKFASKFLQIIFTKNLSTLCSIPKNLDFTISLFLVQDLKYLQSYFVLDNFFAQLKNY